MKPKAVVLSRPLAQFSCSLALAFTAQHFGFGFVAAFAHRFRALALQVFAKPQDLGEFGFRQNLEQIACDVARCPLS